MSKDPVVNDQWQVLLQKLSRRDLRTDEIGPAIVQLGKPYDEQKILVAKGVVESYLHHTDPWVRHEAMWFLASWGKLIEHQRDIIRALQSDPDSDNRSFAALCLAHLRRGSKDQESTHALRDVVLNQKEDAVVRLSAYGALLEICRNQSGMDYQTYEKDLSEIDWAWVGSLP